MSRRGAGARRDRGSAGGADAPLLTVCRGCCCGTASKHPEFDHEAQLARLRAEVGESVRIRVTDCLDVCEQSNVVVVSPSAEGRRTGARPVWLGLLLDPGATDEIIEWVRAGGPGLSDPPGALDLQTFAASRRVRDAAELD